MALVRIRAMQQHYTGPRRMPSQSIATVRAVLKLVWTLSCALATLSSGAHASNHVHVQQALRLISSTITTTTSQSGSPRALACKPVTDVSSLAAVVAANPGQQVSRRQLKQYYQGYPYYYNPYYYAQPVVNIPVQSGPCNCEPASPPSPTTSAPSNSPPPNEPTPGGPLAQWKTIVGVVVPVVALLSYIVTITTRLHKCCNR